MDAEATSAKRPSAQKELWPFGSPRVLVFSAFAVPAAVFYMRFTQSYALGTAMVIILVLGYHATIGTGHTAVAPIRLAHAARICVLVPLLISLHMVATAVLLPMDFPRALGGLMLLTLMLFASAALAEILLNFSDDRFDADIRVIVIILFVIALVGLLGVGPPPLWGETWRRPFFPFAEPAGFALPFCPFFIYACATAAPPRRLLLLILGAAGLALLHTLTLAVAIGLAAAVCLRKRELVLFGAIAVGILAQVNLSYYTERLDFAGETDNLSTLVYLQGWQMLLEGLENSDYLGLGFQQLGIEGTEVTAAQAIRAMRDGEDLNILDGGFLFAKMGAEFGVFGIVVTLGFLMRAYKSIRLLRDVARRGRRVRNVEILAHAIIVTFLIHLFIRSGGYFTGEVLMTVVALWVLSGSKIRFTREPTVMPPGQQAGGV
jgi:hypothetical protein